MSDKTPNETLSGGRVSKIIQVHPSLQCNLFCKHCYSSSAPQFKEGLPHESILRILEEGRDHGYNVVSMSGGEPFLYRPLEKLLQASAELGYFNSVTTNGMLLRSASSQRVLPYVNLVAISIDGKETQHDEIRGLQGAYQKMMEGVKVVQEGGKQFGFIHTVQPNSWQLFPWLAEMALEKGAALLHLHPLELAGRAGDNYASLCFTDEDLHRIYITHYYLQTYYEAELFLQLDLLHRDHIRGNPTFCFHASEACQVNDFSSIFRELIIDEEGDILPIAHGCSRRFKIGNIEEKRSLSQMMDRFMAQHFNDLMAIYRITYEEIMNDPSKEIFNWSELVINNTHRYKELLVMG
jgi:MoaA/NifB/PqqE/SkfB family radical SAM enzyme